MLNNKSISICFLTFFMFTNLFSSVLKLSPKDMSKDDVNLLTDLKDGNLDNFSLYDVALIMSGLESNNKDFKEFEKKFKTIKKDFLKYYKKSQKEKVKKDNNLNYLLELSKDSSKNEEYEKADKLLKFLHENYFRIYGAENSSILDLLTDGKYNCLSSSIVYCLIAKDLGLNVKGVIIPEHTFCILYNKDGNKDIETTIKNGFDPEEKSIAEQDGKIISRNAVNSYYIEREVVEPIELISLLYTNYISNIKEENLYTKDILNKYIKAMYFNPKSKVLRDNLGIYLMKFALKEMAKGNIDFASQLIIDSKKTKKENKLLYSNAVQVFTKSLFESINTLDLDNAKIKFNEYLNFLNDSDNDKIKINLVENTKKISINKVIELVNIQGDINVIRNICNFALQSGESISLDKKLNDFLLELDSFEKEIKEKEFLNDIEKLFNQEKYEEVIVKCEDILKNKVITIDILLNEVQNFKNSAKKIILFNSLVKDAIDKNIEKINIQRIQEVATLNKITGNNDYINSKIEEIKKEFIKEEIKPTANKKSVKKK
jgi:hypothetical protein